jgi:hypothetical protein
METESERGFPNPRFPPYARSAKMENREHSKNRPKQIGRCARGKRGLGNPRSDSQASILETAERALANVVHDFRELPETRAAPCSACGKRQRDTALSAALCASADGAETQGPRCFRGTTHRLRTERGFQGGVAFVPHFPHALQGATEFSGVPCSR